jgi:hypothetical protein
LTSKSTPKAAGERELNDALNGATREDMTINHRCTARSQRNKMQLFFLENSLHTPTAQNGVCTTIVTHFYRLLFFFYTYEIGFKLVKKHT